MIKRPLRILQVSTADIGGGAEKIAWNLFHRYRNRGHCSWLAVGSKRGDDTDVFSLPRCPRNGLWSQTCLNLERRLQPFEGKGRAVARTRRLMQILADPRHELEHRFGVENFDYPGTHRLLELSPDTPDVIHCHNLHGGYFDLRAIPRLSQRAPLILTLHDAWLLSGHCAHSFGCERWKVGCGECPDLSIYPAISRDATAYNWRRKKRILSKSRVYVSTPSKWLMQKVERSLVCRGMVESRVVPNGVDLSVFFPAVRSSARAALELPQDAAIVLFTANRGQTNLWKDYETFRAAAARVGAKMRRHALFICLGGAAGAERLDGAELRFVAYQADAKTVAQFYQAADLYVHPARVDTFPCAVLEALACGTPVVATAVGGIPEQIKGWQGLSAHCAGSNCFGPNRTTGALVPLGDAEAMAQSVERILIDDPLRWQMSKNAAKDARERFDIERQADRYMEWYEEILDRPVQNARRAAVAR